MGHRQLAISPGESPFGKVAQRCVNTGEGGGGHTDGPSHTLSSSASFLSLSLSYEEVAEVEWLSSMYANQEPRPMSVSVRGRPISLSLRQRQVRGPGWDDQMTNQELLEELGQLFQSRDLPDGIPIPP